MDPSVVFLAVRVVVAREPGDVGRVSRDIGGSELLERGAEGVEGAEAADGDVGEPQDAGFEAASRGARDDDGFGAWAAKGCFNVTSTRVFGDRLYQKKHSPYENLRRDDHRGDPNYMSL